MKCDPNWKLDAHLSGWNNRIIELLSIQFDGTSFRKSVKTFPFYNVVGRRHFTRYYYFRSRYYWILERKINSFVPFNNVKTNYGALFSPPKCECFHPFHLLISISDGYIINMLVWVCENVIKDSKSRWIEVDSIAFFSENDTLVTSRYDWICDS